MKKMGQKSKFVFKDLISDTLSEAYTFHNLKAATIYKAQMALVFKPSNERMLDYWPSLQMPNGELKNVESLFVMFNTA